MLILGPHLCQFTDPFLIFSPHSPVLCPPIKFFMKRVDFFFWQSKIVQFLSQYTWIDIYTGTGTPTKSFVLLFTHICHCQLDLEQIKKMPSEKQN